MVVAGSVKRAGSVTQKLIDKIGLLKLDPSIRARKELESVQRSVKSVKNRIEVWRARTGAVSQWQVVNLVTVVEAYLQDVLKSAAQVDPDLMEKSAQSLRYADVIAAGSIDELSDEMRGRWARRWVDDGGPKYWIERLGRMGVRGFPSNLSAVLERLWGIRHVLVHSAGRATPDFVRRHPGIVKARGEFIRLTLNDVRAYLIEIAHFVDSVDAYFLARYPILECAQAR
jgi:hypothetical protein